MSLSLSPGAVDFSPDKPTGQHLVADWAEPQVAWYYMVMFENETRCELRICNYRGPQRVESYAPDGSLQVWESRTVDDELVFYSPDGYSGGGFLLIDNKRLQKLTRMPSEEILKRQLRMRVTR